VTSGIPIGFDNGKDFGNDALERDVKVCLGCLRSTLSDVWEFVESDSHPHAEHKSSIPNNRKNIKISLRSFHFSEEDLGDFRNVKEKWGLLIGGSKNECEWNREKEAHEFQEHTQLLE